MRRAEVVVITGASSGIGRATAHEFARRHANLVLTARDESGLDDVVAECTARGGRAVAHAGDVSDATHVASIAQRAIDEFGRLDVWVGAASVYAFGTFERTPPEVFRQVMETNLFGQVDGARVALPIFRRQGSGTLILVASVYGKSTAPYVSAYVTSKWATLGFSQSLSHELHGSGVAVCAVLPSTVDTPIHSHAANYTGENVHPLPPIIRPHRVARAIVRLSRHPRPVTVMGQTQRIFIPLHAISARGYSVFVRTAWRIFGLRGGSVTPHAGTVFAPDPPSNTVKGGWRSPLVRTGLLFGALSAVAIMRAGQTRTHP